MSDRLVLRDEVLGHAVAAMGDIRTDFESVGDACQNVSAVCGHPRLADALRDFATTWGIHRRRLADKLCRTQEELQTIHDQFQIVDDEFGRACGSPGPGSGHSDRSPQPGRGPDPTAEARRPPPSGQGDSPQTPPSPARPTVPSVPRPYPPAESPPAPNRESQQESPALTPAAAELVDRLETVVEKLEGHEELVAGVAAGVGFLGLALLAGAGKVPLGFAAGKGAEGQRQVGSPSAQRAAAVDALGRGHVVATAGVPPEAATTPEEATRVLREDRNPLEGVGHHGEQPPSAGSEPPWRPGGLHSQPAGHAGQATESHPASPMLPSRGGPATPDGPGTAPTSASRAPTVSEGHQGTEAAAAGPVRQEEPSPRRQEDPLLGASGSPNTGPGGAMLGMASLGSLAAMRAGRGSDQSAADDEERLKTAKRLLERLQREVSGEEQP